MMDSDDLVFDAPPEQHYVLLALDKTVVNPSTGEYNRNLFKILQLFGITQVSVPPSPNITEAHRVKLQEHGIVADSVAEPSGPVIFVNDSEQARKAYAAAHQEELVLSPPHCDQGFSYQDQQCYMPCGFFVREFGKKVGGFSLPFNDAKVEILLQLARSDEEAAFLAEALYLYKIAYVVSSNESIKESIRRIEEGDLVLATTQNFPSEYYNLPERYALELERIHDFNNALQGFNDALLNLKVSIPSAFVKGAWANFKRIFSDFSEPKAIVANALDRLAMTYVGLYQYFADSPKTQEYCLLATERYQRDCVSLVLRSKLKAITPTLPRDTDCIKRIITTRVTHNSYATGFLGLTGVPVPNKTRKIPLGVDIVFKAKSLDEMVGCAQQRLSCYSFWRAPDTKEFYQEVAGMTVVLDIQQT